MENRERAPNWRLFNYRLNRLRVSLGILFFPFGLVFADEVVIDRTLKDKKFQKSTDIEKIEFYETTSRITGNTCGPESDWPCLEDNGCLVIKRLQKVD